MEKHPHPNSEEVEQLMLNAQLRDELEPYVDESLDLMNERTLTTSRENEFLASMLAWERAPALPIARWFTPELLLPSPETLSDNQLHNVLWETIHKLDEERIVLDFTDHLSDRQLYCLIYRDILPSPEKKVDNPRNYLHWDCLDVTSDPENWLKYYATEEERFMWADETGQSPPPSEPPPHPRRMPRRTL